MARGKEARRDSVSAILEAAAAGDASARVNCVVFSKNRAMQLDACLRSIERFAPYDARVTAVYTTTDAGFAEGYDLLTPPPGVHLVAQSNDFQRDVLEALDRRHEYTVFHTDDDLFFRPAPAPPLLSAALAAFSLRLGRNTRYCYPRASAQPVPDAAEHGPYIAWSWPRAQLDFAYPLSLDGHVMLDRPRSAPRRRRVLLQSERAGGRATTAAGAAPRRSWPRFERAASCRSR